MSSHEDRQRAVYCVYGQTYPYAIGDWIDTGERNTKPWGVHDEDYTRLEDVVRLIETVRSAGAAEERERVVRWLRDGGEPAELRAADEIERGEHAKEGE